MVFVDSHFCSRVLCIKISHNGRTVIVISDIGREHCRLSATQRLPEIPEHSSGSFWLLTQPVDFLQHTWSESDQMCPYGQIGNKRNDCMPFRQTSQKHLPTECNTQQQSGDPAGFTCTSHCRKPLRIFCMVKAWTLRKSSAADTDKQSLLKAIPAGPNSLQFV